MREAILSPKQVYSPDIINKSLLSEYYHDEKVSYSTEMLSYFWIWIFLLLLMGTLGC